MDWNTSPVRASLETAPAELSVVVWSNGMAQLPPRSETIDPRDDTRNPGVGPRYLAAANLAGERGDRFLLLLDQDFTAPAGWWSAYEQALQTEPLAQCWVPEVRAEGRRLSPFVVRNGRPRQANPLPNGTLPALGHAAINSGLLIRTESLLSAARELTAMPLDFSDYALFHRLARSDARIGRVDISLDHDLSSLQPASTEVRLGRFVWFCRGARAWADLDRSHRGPVFRWSLGRACLLSVRHGFDRRFLAHWYRLFRLGLPE